MLIKERGSPLSGLNYWNVSLIEQPCTPCCLFLSIPLCTWSLLSLSLFSESIVVQYTQYGLNGSKIFLIKDGLVTGTPRDSPLGEALRTKLYQNFPCVVAPIYFSDKRNSLKNLSKYPPFMCIICSSRLEDNCYWKQRAMILSEISFGEEEDI